MDIDPVNTTNGGQIAKAVHSGANECSTAVSTIEKLPLHRYRRTITARSFRKSGNLTFNRMRGRLLFAGNPRVERRSN